MTMQERAKARFHAVLVAGKTYPTPLPEELASWYVYTVDGGHSLLAIPVTLLHSGSLPDSNILVPVPVKAVLRQYHIVNGFIIADAVLYDDYRKARKAAVALAHADERACVGFSQILAS